MDLSTELMSATDLLRPFKAKAIASALGIDLSVVYAYRRGESIPSVDKVEALARLTNCPVENVVRILTEDLKRSRQERIERARAAVA